MLSSRAKHWIYAIVLLGICAVITVYSSAKYAPSAVSTPMYRTYVTAAHVGPVAGYNCVYVDEASDYAVHVALNYACQRVAVGDTVHVAGTQGKVLSTHDKYFTMSVDNVSMIIPGVSGSIAYRGEEAVGFLSGWGGQGALCVTYY